MTEPSPTEYKIGLNPEQAESKRRDILCRATCASSTVLLILYAMKDAATGEPRIALVVSIYAIVNLVTMALYERFRMLNAFSYYLVFAVCSLVLFLVASGGSGNSGILWLPAFPILIFSILPTRRATIITLFIYAIVTFILFGPKIFIIQSDYSPHVKYAGMGATLLVGIFTFIQARTREISSQAITKLNAELQKIASTDALTLLANRRDMSARLEFECKRANRTGEEFSIILCDIDYFKKINDSFGHSVGDQTLIAFSRLFESRFRETDKVGRWGGEEFLVILPATRLEEAITTANDVRLEICKTSLLENTPNRLVTMSAGVASSKENTNAGELLKIADDHLYEAKNNGRNCVKPDR